ncbi:MAG: hypothetical protein ABS882_01355 [Lysinibacillus sp.]
MIKINTSLAVIHKKLQTHISTEKYADATSYVAQFIPYTTIWNIKFTYNLESPEVALMQILHLEYIFSNEDANLFTKERAILVEMKQLFLAYSPYSKNLIALRKQRFLDFSENAQ